MLDRKGESDCNFDGELEIDLEDAERVSGTWDITRTTWRCKLNW